MAWRWSEDARSKKFTSRTLYLYRSTAQTEDPIGGETDSRGGETVEDVHAQTAEILVDEDEDKVVIRVFEEYNSDNDAIPNTFDDDDVDESQMHHFVSKTQIEPYRSHKMLLL